MQKELRPKTAGRRRLRARTILSALVLIGMTFGGPQTPAFAQEAAQAAQPQCQGVAPRKKKGFGLGGILGATQQMGGMGRILGGGIMGKGQIAGAVLGTAIDAASSAARNGGQGEPGAAPAPCPQGQQVAAAGSASPTPTAPTSAPLPRPGLGKSTAAPAGKAFGFPLGIELRQPIRHYDSSRPRDCGNKDRSKAYGTDGNLIALCLVFANKTKAPIRVTLPPGLVFVSRKLETQNGILVQSVSIDVPPTQAFYAPILLYCANGNRHGSGDGDLFDLGPVIEAPEFQSLFRKLQAKDLTADTGQLIQGTVWNLGDEGRLSSLLEPGIDALPARSR